MDEWSIESGGGAVLRQAYRTKIPGFLVKFLPDGPVFPVKDLSACGFSVRDETGRFAGASLHQVEFYLNKKLFLGGVIAKVMRVSDSGIVGFNFEELERRQVIRLDKLVLEVQKRLIRLRKDGAEG